MAVLEVDVDATLDAGVHKGDVGGPGVVALEEARWRSRCVRSSCKLVFELEER